MMKKVNLLFLSLFLCSFNLFSQNQQTSQGTQTILNGYGDPVEVAEMLNVANNTNVSVNTIATNPEVVHVLPCPNSSVSELAFDGEYLWVGGYNTYELHQVSPVDGSIIKTIPTSVKRPYGLTFDGTDLWVADNEGLVIHKVDTANGSILTTFQSPGRMLHGPHGLAWDGDNFWHTDSKSNLAITPGDSIFKFSPDSTVLLGHPDVGTYPTGLAFDGNYLWSSDNPSNQIYKLDTVNFGIIETIIAPGGNYPNGLTFDGQYLWVGNNDSDSLYKVDINNCTSHSVDTITAFCGSFVWLDGNTYTSSNTTATYILTNTSGCDSIITLNLTLNQNISTIDTQTACNSFIWINGNTYTSSNSTATDTLTSTLGCDSIIHLNLTIHNSDIVTDTQTACNSYIWVDGNTYASSNNTATYTFTNINGCDSIVNLDLTIYNSDTVIDTQTACNNYVWIDGNTYTSSNNTVSYTLTNIHGCDSVVYLDLTINPIDTSTDIQTICDSLIWIDGNIYTSSNTTASYTLTNVFGCDSVVHLDLTVNHSDMVTDTQMACDNYIWIDGNTYTSSNSTASHTLTNMNGCDSVIRLNLTINHTDTVTDQQTVCDSLVWIDGITYTTPNTTASYTLTNVDGCDSIVLLDLSLNTLDTSVHVSGQVLTAASGLEYQWINCIDNTPIIGEVNQMLSAPYNGDFAVVIANNQCVDTSTCYRIQSVDIVENIKNDYTIYPNPFNNSFKIDLGKEHISAQVKITDVEGRVVFERIFNSKKDIEISSDFAVGIYFVYILTDGNPVVFRVVKE